ncbi:sigma factor [Streptomyces hoynatensis]|uniref:RNA polymerase subunit sigma-70 n=1 Tax=Streptomyces hoynatensis TaxID=1141874 RepID=A0A3A9Z1E7_9ACTN|nr:sigma factor [Streptomyces hoynatensis]RKN42221.1 RNA polymerase subunit sigma-70 [Streptomyces hoynatensis]
MNESDWLIERFAEHRPRLGAVAYRLLGSPGEAEEAVRRTWLRLRRSDTTGVRSLGPWLTAVLAGLCHDALRARAARLGRAPGPRVPEPVVSPMGGAGPEQRALLAGLSGLGGLVALEGLRPAERVSFVLHDMFAVPWEEIARILGRSAAATRQLAARARREARGATTASEGGPARQRAAAESYLTAVREGSPAALGALLAPGAVLRVDLGRAGASRELRGAAEVAGAAGALSRLAAGARPVLVNGAAGVVTAPRGVVLSVTGLTVAADGLARIDVLADPERLRRLPLPPAPVAGPAARRPVGAGGR